ncbi:hypothetical protein BH09MYX1_BH09MYX1_01790 [soil metagenome]
MSPYRHSAATPALEEGAVACPDGDLLPTLAIFWALSVVRVALGVARHEMSGTEGTLALLAALLVPWLVKDAVAWSVGRCKVAAAKLLRPRPGPKNF